MIACRTLSAGNVNHLVQLAVSIIQPSQYEGAAGYPVVDGLGGHSAERGGLSGGDEVFDSLRGIERCASQYRSPFTAKPQLEDQPGFIGAYVYYWHESNMFRPSGGVIQDRVEHHPRIERVMLLADHMPTMPAVDGVESDVDRPVQGA